MEETKHCSGCGQVKPVDAFGWKDKTKGLRQARCPDCARAYQAQWYQRNKHAHKERSRHARQHRFIANDPVIQAAKACRVRIAVSGSHRSRWTSTMSAAQSGLTSAVLGSGFHQLS